MQCFPRSTAVPLRGNPPGEPDDKTVPDHRIVTPVQDLPVVGEEEVCIPVQFCHRLINIRDHRVPGHVGTGHDEQRVFQVGEEQVVKSCIGKHAADRMEIADRCMGSRIAFFYDNNGMDRAFQAPVFLRGNDCQPVDIIRAYHDGKWLFNPAKATF